MRKKLFLLPLGLLVLLLSQSCSKTSSNDQKQVSKIRLDKITADVKAINARHASKLLRLNLLSSVNMGAGDSGGPVEPPVDPSLPVEAFSWKKLFNAAMADYGGAVIGARVGVSVGARIGTVFGGQTITGAVAGGIAGGGIMGAVASYCNYTADGGGPDTATAPLPMRDTTYYLSASFEEIGAQHDAILEELMHNHNLPSPTSSNFVSACLSSLNLSQYERQVVDSLFNEINVSSIMTEIATPSVDRLALPVSIDNGGAIDVVSSSLKAGYFGTQSLPAALSLTADYSDYVENSGFNRRGENNV